MYLSTPFHEQDLMQGQFLKVEFNKLEFRNFFSKVDFDIRYKKFCHSYYLPIAD